jgi:hypothetical protein
MCIKHIINLVRHQDEENQKIEDEEWPEADQVNPMH